MTSPPPVRVTPRLLTVGLAAALVIACTDGKQTETTTTETTSTGDGDGDGDGDMTGDGDGDPASGTTTTGCEPGTFGCACDNDMCIEGLECDDNGECSFPAGDGDGDPAPPNDPTVFDCVSTEVVTLGEFTGDPNSQIISAPVNELDATLSLDFWAEGPGVFDLGDAAQWDGGACTHCVYMVGDDGSWWAAEGTLTIDEWVTFEISTGDVTGLRLQQTQMVDTVYTQSFVPDPTCYTIEAFAWDTLMPPGDGDGDMTGDGDGDLTGDGDGDLTGDGDGDLTGDGDGDMTSTGDGDP